MSQVLRGVHQIGFWDVITNVLRACWSMITLCEEGLWKDLLTQGPPIHFSNGLRAHNWNLGKIHFALIVILMIWSGQNFAHATTAHWAQLSWHVQNVDLISALLFIQQQHVILQDLDYEIINSLWNASQMEGKQGHYRSRPSTLSIINIAHISTWGYCWPKSKKPFFWLRNNTRVLQYENAVIPVLS